MDNFAKLQWRCRRGTLELDMILSCYLKRCFASANTSERQLFMQLLELQDSELSAYLLGGVSPDSQELTQLVDKIRNFVKAES